MFRLWVEAVVAESDMNFEQRCQAEAIPEGAGYKWKGFVDERTTAAHRRILSRGGYDQPFLTISLFPVCTEVVLSLFQSRRS